MSTTPISLDHVSNQNTMPVLHQNQRSSPRAVLRMDSYSIIWILNTSGWFRLPPVCIQLFESNHSKRPAYPLTHNRAKAQRKKIFILCSRLCDYQWINVQSLKCKQFFPVSTSRRDDVTLYIMHLLFITPFKRLSSSSVHPLAVSTAAAALPGCGGILF